MAVDEECFDKSQAATTFASERARSRGTRPVPAHAHPFLRPSFPTTPLRLRQPLRLTSSSWLLPLLYTSPVNEMYAQVVLTTTTQHVLSKRSPFASSQTETLVPIRHRAHPDSLVRAHKLPVQLATLSFYRCLQAVTSTLLVPAQSPMFILRSDPDSPTSNPLKYGRVSRPEPPRLAGYRLRAHLSMSDGVE